MLTAFKEIPGNAKVWIFQSSTVLTDSQMQELHRISTSFVEGWTAHSRELKAGFTIIDRLFLVFSVDESLTGASGCSIDKLHQFIKGREGAMGLQLLNRLLVAFPGETEPKIIKLHEVSASIANGQISSESLVYDSTITNKADFDERFIAPLAATWLSRYLPS